MDKITEKLIRGNEQFVKKVNSNKEHLESLDNLKIKQSPTILVFCCSDSRVIPEYIFDQFFGELFVIRTAGNVINEGELASAEYALEHLNIKYVLMMGHTSCGAVHAAVHNEKGRFLDPILSRIKINVGETCDEKEASIKNAMAEMEYLKDKFSYIDGVTYKYALYDIATRVCKIY